ncbi:hypothetical protein CK203_073922 [Vitis vinifera]|uniref:Uncharacterized protein n=1 Tax=Vitis vinifera TaxID=29760 RepID=A0A438DQ52_VITVI|nr:hypothetical protein CK203_073922 [Vitis vinifera]
MCSDYYDCEGQIHDIKNQKSEFEQVIKEMEDNGMRSIAFAYKQTEVQELVEDGLCLLAIVGVKYQCHEEMKLPVRAPTSAGHGSKYQSSPIRLDRVRYDSIESYPPRASPCQVRYLIPDTI